MAEPSGMILGLGVSTALVSISPHICVARIWGHVLGSTNILPLELFTVKLFICKLPPADTRQWRLI